MPETPLDAVERELANGATISIITLVNCLIEKAHASRASDIHIDPTHDVVRVKMRIDGVLHTIYSLPKQIHGEVISRLKVLAGLRTDEHQATQDGRFRFVFPTGSEFIDIRISIAPTYHGENAVMRLLSDHAEQHTLEMLGFSASDRTKIQAALKKPSGMILATGPTGSGKTTTLYTLIKMLNADESSIVTIEDPIEYAVGNVRQIQVNPKAGLTFANGLRSMLRQDPDIIMVGEIRDAETASIAVNTALTGHLLLSTLHTNDAATTLPRLLDLGVDAFLVASTVSIAIGQRLVRKICPHCKEDVVITQAQADNFAHVPLKQPIQAGEVFAKGKGCDECSNTGYIGRLCINEVLVADNDIREAILRRTSSAELKAIAVRGGMTTILEDGFEKARRKETSIEEVLRVVHD